MDATHLLKQSLDQFHPISDTDFDRFQAIGKPVHFAKKAYLLTAGEVCRGFHFIASGSVRKFEWVKDREIHREFFFEQDMATDLASMRNKEPAKVNMVAMEPVSAIFFSGAEMFALYEESPRFVELGRRILEVKLLDQQDFSALLLNLNPSERYTYILEHRPHLIQRIPLQYLPTYLGMTRETLSRIRGRQGG